MKNIYSSFSLGLWLFIVFSNLYAVDKHPTEFATTMEEARYQLLTEELRCVVCQNQSIADSNAELAQDMRDLVRNMIIEGKTNEDITGFLVERYGDFVLYNPPIKSITYLLWLGPLILLLSGIAMIIFFVRRHANATAVPPTLTAEEQKQLTQIVTDSPYAKRSN